QTVQGRKKANEARFDQRGPEDGRRRAGCGRTRSGARCPRGEPVPCLPERFQRKDTPVPGRGAPQVHRRSASASGSRPAAGGRGAEGVLPAEPVVAAGAATRLRGGRLRRQVDVRQEVYLTLRREYETARIDEANDTP